MNKSVGGSTADSVSQMNEQRMGQFTSNSHPRTDFVHQRPLAQPGGDPRAGPSQREGEQQIEHRCYDNPELHREASRVSHSSGATAGQCDMKVYSVYSDLSYSPSYGTSDTNLSTPSTVSPESLYSWREARTDTKQVVDIRPQLPLPFEETMSPARQQHQQRRLEEAGKQQLPPSVGTTSHDIEQERRNDRESQSQNSLDPSQASRRQQQSLPMGASQHIEELRGSTLPRRPGLPDTYPEDSLPFTVPQLQLLFSLFYQALQQMFRDTAEPGPNTTNPGTVVSNPPPPGGVTLSRTRLSDPVSSFNPQTIEPAAMRYSPGVLSSMRSKAVQSNINPPASDTSSPSLHQATSQQDGLGNLEVPANTPSPAQQFQNQQPHLASHSLSLPQPDDVLKPHTTDTSELLCYENQSRTSEVLNREGTTDSELESDRIRQEECVTDFRFQNSPSEPIIV